jgi:BirA family transcriptional regulator, biotin operon repressor / biotin---[acetyl-CoA-carboxylase] ligase
VTTELQTWADRLEAAIASHDVACTDRIAVITETASTQDAALAMCGGAPGLLVVAGRQTGGRGRLGRQWTDAAGEGVAATFVLSAREPGTLALAAGLGACRAIENLCDARIGLRWPNDVVERAGAGRKIAGVLVEAKPGIALVGIGINVAQSQDSWPPGLAGRACSLRMLGSGASRIDAAEALLLALNRALRLEPEAVAAEWAARDVVLGTQRLFECDGRRVRGLVQAIRPSSFVQVRTEDGQTVRLPALTTSLINE